MNDGMPLAEHGLTTRVVRSFLRSNMSAVFILLAVAAGAVALIATPREEDPQIIVPMADVFVSFPGHSAQEVEQLVSQPLERILYQIDGVEHVYSMSRPDQAVITVRFYTGEDRERSLVKLYKKIDENVDLVPPGVAGWVVKPVEIDDVPIVTLTLTSPTAGEYLLRRTAEECVARLAAVKDVSRAYVIGGLPRVVKVRLGPDRVQGFGTSPLEVARALRGANVLATAGEFDNRDEVFGVEAGRAFRSAAELRELVVGVYTGRPVFLKDVADVEDGPAEVTSYVRHGWGPGLAWREQAGEPGAVLGGSAPPTGPLRPHPAVTIALAKKKGTNAVGVAEEVLAAAEALRREVVPGDVEMVITRNSGLDANDKVNELIESLLVALILVFAVITYGLGRRESLIVALAVPVTMMVSMAVSFTITPWLSYHLLKMFSGVTRGLGVDFSTGLSYVG